MSHTKEASTKELDLLMSRILKGIEGVAEKLEAQGIAGSDMSEDDKLDLIDAEYDDKERDRRLNEGEPTVD